MDRVSIIIPVFNRFEYADRAIRSVLNQTYSNWELLVVDDCSKFKYSLPLDCEKLSQNIALLRNEINVGPGLSRQRGLDLAKGSFVCFLDSDDYYHSNFIFKSLQAHIQNPGFAATYTTAIYIQTGLIREGSNQTHRNIMPTLFEQRRPWPTCSLLWNRASLATWKPLRSNEDSLFELECSFINNNILHIQEVLCFIDKSTTKNTADFIKDKAAEIHRNVVALYALKNINKIKVDHSEQRQLKLAICKRLVYVSSKLAGHGLGLEVMKNGLKLMSLSWKAGIFLMLLGIPANIPIKSLQKSIKHVIAAY